MMYACCSVSSTEFIDGATTSASQSHITTYQGPLVNAVLRYQGRYPLKLQRIIRHQHGAGGNGVLGASGVDRGAGEAQHQFNLRGRIYRCAVPGQNGTQNASTNCSRGGEAFGPVAPKRISE